MSNEEIEEATDLVINAIIKSELNNYTKLELMVNLRTFFENYENNIRLLRKGIEDEKKKKI
ncbi:MAG: hypothetical protein IKI95_05910 [Clostridia bacterium]|nr:hypothetical protein [Clostridia bacterium]